MNRVMWPLDAEQERYLRAHWSEPMKRLADHFHVRRETVWIWGRRMGLPCGEERKALGGNPTTASKYDGGDSDTPKCACGGRLSFETWNGYAREVCRSCSLERQIPSKGVRKYDQRDRMERFWAEEEGRSEAQKAQTRKPGRAPQLNVRRGVA